jgi:hypothetical protein
MLRFFRIAFALITIAHAGPDVAQVTQKIQSATQAGMTLGRNTHLEHGLVSTCDVQGRASRSHLRGCDEVLYAKGGEGTDG